MEALLKESRQILSKNPAKIEQDLDFFLNWNEQNLPEQYEKISQTIDESWNFPTLPTFNLLKHKVRLEIELEKYQDAALTLLQSQALSFRHQALNQYLKKLQNDENDELASMHEIILKFQTLAKSHQQIQDMMKNLPSDWTIVQISVNDNFSDSRFKKTPSDKAVAENFSLLLVNYSNDSATIHEISQLPNEDKMRSVQAELQDILNTHKLMYKSDEKRPEKYRKTREEVDERIASLVTVLENKLLNFNKVLLLGKSENDEKIEKICDSLQKKYFKTGQKEFISSGKRKLLHKIIDGYDFLDQEQIFKGLENIKSGDLQFQKEIEKICASFSSKVPRSPLVLILDKEIQNLPWETMKFLENHPISRVPSLHTLALLHKTHLENESVPNRGEIRQSKIFYVLNPDQNLAKTQAKLEPTFTNLGSGVIGQQPSLPQMKKVLSEMDAYLYCGHGSTLKKFSNQEIEKLNIRALPLLFGCESGQLQRLGRLNEPIGTVTHYMIGQAPSLLGFLYSITDKDVDQWTVEFLKHWLDESEHQLEFVQAVSNKRSAFEREINRAAVVVYGLPSLKKAK